MGLALIAAGTLSLAIGLWEYAVVKRYLWSRQFAAVAGMAREPWHTPMVAVTVLLLLIGLAAFVRVAVAQPLASWSDGASST